MSNQWNSLSFIIIETIRVAFEISFCFPPKSVFFIEIVLDSILNGLINFYSLN